MSHARTWRNELGERIGPSLETTPLLEALDSLANTTGCVDLLRFLRPDQKKAALQQRGVQGSIQTLRKVQRALKKLKEFEQAMKVTDIHDALWSGTCQTKGWSREGEAVLWIAQPTNTRNLKDFSATVVRDAWSFLWAARVAAAESNGRVLLVYYDTPGRSLLDFNAALIRQSQDILATLAAFEKNTKLRIIMATNRKTSRLLFAMMAKALPSEFAQVVRHLPLEKVYDYLTDPKNVPNLFSGSSGKFTPSFDTLGSYPMLLRREGVAMYTEQDIINWEHSDRHSLAKFRRDTAAWEESQTTSRCSLTISRPLRRPLLLSIQEDSDVTGGSDASESLTDGSNDECSQSWNGETLF